MNFEKPGKPTWEEEKQQVWETLEERLKNAGVDENHIDDYYSLFKVRANGIEPGGYSEVEAITEDIFIKAESHLGQKDGKNKKE